uniref:Cytochrome c oxidase subunit 3 n=1 Tax=Dicyema japonicum TaxID=399803 RepID=A0A3G1SC05_DICJA|nr:cytochrome c oxidase subunit 3 [Dicyema japonicum]
MSRSYVEMGVTSIPVMMSFALSSLLVSMGNYLMMYESGNPQSIMMMMSLISFSMVTMIWFRDSIRDSQVGLYPISFVSNSMMFIGFVIFSEVMVFFGVLWSFSWSMLIPSVWTGFEWPLVGMSFFDPFSLPLLGTSLLISSAVFVTWSHGSSSLKGTMISLLFSILLGSCFVCIQFIEYLSSSFTISSSSFGSCFFVATGLHGLHVIIGLFFLAFSLFRLSRFHNAILDGPIWYWHFVDYVWLLVFTMGYLFPSL